MKTAGAKAFSLPFPEQCMRPNTRVSDATTSRPRRGEEFSSGSGWGNFFATRRWPFSSGNGGSRKQAEGKRESHNCDPFLSHMSSNLVRQAIGKAI